MERSARYPRYLILLVLALSAPLAQGQMSVEGIGARAGTLVAEERYDEAIELYREGLAAYPGDRALLRGLAQTLSWAGRYDEAIAIYRSILAADPYDDSASLGYARTLQWSGDYAAAREELRGLLSRSPENLDALEELARTNYWRGDFRSAARQYERLLALDPSRTSAAAELTEIRSASRPIVTSSVFWRSDDQPLDSVGGEIEAVAFSDPLTRWSLSLLTNQFDAPLDSSNIRSARLSVSSSFPWPRLSAGASLGPTEMPTGETEWFGGLWVEGRLTDSLRGRLFYSRDELLWSIASLETTAHVSSTGAEIRYEREGRLGSVRIRDMEFSDGNGGADASGYALVPLVDRGWTLAAGGSFLLRDTDESRFVIDLIHSIPANSGYAYEYEGIYDPYWTPLNLREIRLLLSASGVIGDSLEWRVDSTAGVARDDAVTFGPASGQFPDPPETFQSTYERTYNPWSIALTVQKQWDKVAFQMRLERTVTVHYEADEAIATLVRRF